MGYSAEWSADEYENVRDDTNKSCARGAGRGPEAPFGSHTTSKR
jgi:hypothetical protein